jgi:SAM-dependent methyltransferase
MHSFCDYEPFAWLYTHYWGKNFHQQIMPALERVVLSQLPPGAAVLDLCCGDGRLTEKLHHRGFRTTGLDGSPRMLAYARERCPQAELLLKDAREFNLPPRFEAVISTFDSLNHVLRTGDLRKVFSNVRRCLKPGGVFVFDLNGEPVYRERWCNPGSLVNEEVVSVSRGEYNQRRRLARCDITLLCRNNGQWTRSDFQLVQKCHAKESVARLLEKTGFSVSVHEAAKVGMEGDFNYGRDIYVGRVS